MTEGLKTRKPLTSKGFSYQCLFLIIVVCTGLFADTKPAKYLIEQVLSCDTPGEFAEVM